MLWVKVPLSNLLLGHIEDCTNKTMKPSTETKKCSLKVKAVPLDTEPSAFYTTFCCMSKTPNQITLKALKHLVYKTKSWGRSILLEKKSYYIRLGHVWQYSHINLFLLKGT